MSMDHTVWRDDEGVPAKLVPLLGKRVYRAWLPTPRLLCVRLEGGYVIAASPVRTDAPNATHAVELMIGSEGEKAAEGFATLDISSRQDAHLKDLRGRRLTGMDKDVLVFDDKYGAKIELDGVRWVMTED